MSTPIRSDPYEPAGALRVGARVTGPDGFEGVIEEVAGGVARVRHAGGVLVLPTPLIRADAFPPSGDVEPSPETLVVPVLAESIDVSRTTRTTGAVRVTKRVEQDEAVVDEPVIRERVEVERRTVNRVVESAPPVREEGDTTIVPIVEEVLVVEKRLLLREEVHLRRVRETVHEPQTFALRRERADVERIDAPPGDAR
jgi:uncharacterized protein (TIGR02271 family)